MSNRVKIEVEGFQELANKLKFIANDKSKKKEALLILRQIAKPTLAASKTTVPISKRAHWVSGQRTKKKIVPGNLKKSLGIITATKSEDPQVVVGPRAKRKFDGWYGHFVHEGHRVFNHGSMSLTRDSKGRFVSNKVTGRITAKSAKGKKIGASHKNTKANPFLTRAYDQTQGKVTADAEAKFVKFVQRRLNKLQ